MGTFMMILFGKEEKHSEFNQPIKEKSMEQNNNMHQKGI